MEELLEPLRWLLGIDVEPNELTVIQMGLRGLIIYATTFTTVQVGRRRFLGSSTVFDVILGVILGSVASRAVNGAAALGPTIVTGLLLVFTHMVLSELAYRSRRVGGFIRGKPIVLYKDGKPNAEAMRANNITEDDLISAARENANRSGPEDIEQATLEPSGEISIVHKKPAPAVFHIGVKDGVQIVRIELQGAPDWLTSGAGRVEGEAPAV